MPDSLSILERAFVDTTRRPTREERPDLRMIETCGWCGYWRERGDLKETYDEEDQTVVRLCVECIDDTPLEEEHPDDDHEL